MEKDRERERGRKNKKKKKKKRKNNNKLFKDNNKVEEEMYRLMRDKLCRLFSKQMELISAGRNVT